MNKKINQICQQINCEDILAHKFYPVWFFSNEKISNFFQKVEDHQEIKRVFSIAGGGDFAFSVLATKSLNQISEVNVCDIRQMASVTIDFKLALFKNLSYQEILNLFLERKFFDKWQTYRKLEKIITPLTKIIFDSILKKYKKNDFLKCLKKSGLWYRDSFWQIKNKKEYFPYLVSEARYRLLQQNLAKISIYCGDFRENLNLFQKNYFNLIYISNILDSKEYCQESNLYLKAIREKLEQNGLLFVVTQNNFSKMIKLIEKQGFSIYKKELPKFNPISLFLGHYAYSFLLFQKNQDT